MSAEIEKLFAGSRSEKQQRVQVGEFMLVRFAEGGTWLLHVSGDAMEVNQAKLEKVLRNFWRRNF